MFRITRGTQLLPIFTSNSRDEPSAVLSSNSWEKEPSFLLDFYIDLFIDFEVQFDSSGVALGVEWVPFGGHFGGLGLSLGAFGPQSVLGTPFPE